MLRTLTVACLALGVSVLPAVAASANSECRSLAMVETQIRDAAADLHQSVDIRDLTIGQFHFATAIYAFAPHTPTELPKADKATLGTFKGADIAILVFSDHGRVCIEPLMIKSEVVALIDQTQTGRREFIAPAPSADGGETQTF